MTSLSLGHWVIKFLEEGARKSEVGDQRSVPLSVISYLLFGKFVSVSCFIVFYDFYDFYDFNDFNDLTI